MSLLLILNSCAEINNTQWLVRGAGITYSNTEVCPEIAQFKILLNSAKIWCYSQENPAVCSMISPNGDSILRLNEPALKLLNLSRENVNSRLSCREFWRNQGDYEGLIRDLRQCGKAESKIELINYDGLRIGDVGVVAELLPDSPVFVSRTI